MLDAPEISDVIGKIYKASYKPDFWPTALERIAKFTNSSSAMYIYVDNELEKVNSTYYYNVPEESIREYNEYGVDPNFGIFLEKVPLGRAAAVDHLVPDRQQLEAIYGETFIDIIVKADTPHAGGVILLQDEIRTAAIALQRNKTLGVWNKEEISRLNLLVPHLKQAIAIQKEFTRLQTREQALKRGLDRLIMGLVLFDKELQVIYINPVAKSILEYHPAIYLQNNKIYAQNHKDTERIQKGLFKAISSNDFDNPSDFSTAIGLRHPGCATTLPVLISTIHGVFDGFEAGGRYAHVVMCFSDPERSNPIEADKLAEVYELTRAEAQVAISIANGLSVEETASMNDVAVSTIRSQLKSIFRKLGINRQNELVKLLLTGPFGGAI